MSKQLTFQETLRKVQNYMSTNFSMAFDGQNPERQKTQMLNYISKFIRDEEIEVIGMNQEQLLSKLWNEMVEYSFLTEYLNSSDIEEININSWEDVKITKADGSIISTEKFRNAEHAEDVIKRLLHASGMILDNAQPLVRGHLSNQIRITAIGNGVVDKSAGVACSIRIVNPKKLDKKDFVAFKTATDEMLEFISDMLRYDISQCVTGATGSGKTTVMQWILTTIPNHKRIYTIENGVREFNLVKKDAEGNVLNNVVHTVTRDSDDPKQVVDQEKLLEYALTFNPDIIVVGEMKSSEAFAAQEAARTGHAVVTTTHANGCEATYRRMVTLCKMKYDIDDNTLFKLVTEAFPIVLFTKKLEDKSRKIMEISECEILPNEEREIRTLYRYNITDNSMKDGKIKGEFEKVNTISKSLQKRLLDNGMPEHLIQKYL